MPIMEVNVHEAKTNFSKLLRRVAAGEEIIIAKAGVPVAKLVPVEQKHAKRKLGLYRGEIWVADDFDAPLPDDVPSTAKNPTRKRKLRNRLPGSSGRRDEVSSRHGHLVVESGCV